jgi:hypothetical protein
MYLKVETSKTKINLLMAQKYIHSFNLVPSRPDEIDDMRQFEYGCPEATKNHNMFETRTLFNLKYEFLHHSNNKYVFTLQKEFASQLQQNAISISVYIK